jgi:hypothetical protein
MALETKTRQELVQLAQQIVDGLVFCSAQIRPEERSLLGQVFMPLFFMDEAMREELAGYDPGLFYEYIAEAGPRGINGYPCFMSVKTLNRADAAFVLELAQQLQAESDLGKRLGIMQQALSEG